MKTKKRYRGYGTILLFALAATLLIFSTVGSSRAVLNYQSDIYAAQVLMQNIGVSLLENGKTVSNRDYEDGAAGEWDENTGALLTKLLETREDGTKETLQSGKAYPEALSVVNSGTIDEYVRVTIYHYWEGKDGKRRTDLDPSLIDLHLTLGDKWIVDPNPISSTDERTILYYRQKVGGKTGEAGNVQYEETDPFSDTLTIKGFDGVEVKAENVYDETGKLIETRFTYDGATFVLRVDVDAVQTHNAAAAIKSAWGVVADLDANGNIVSVQS